MFAELFSLLAAVFAGSFFLSASFVSAFGLLEETDPELDRWSVE